MRDPGGMLLRALLAHAGGEGAASCRAAHSEQWASVTFTGARHGFSLLLTGPDAAGRAARLEREIGEMPFALPGHLVADILVTKRACAADGEMLEIEALTLEEA